MAGPVDLDRRVLGPFLDHLDRAVYTGGYETGPRLADWPSAGARMTFNLPRS